MTHRARQRRLSGRAYQSMTAAGCRTDSRFQSHMRLVRAADDESILEKAVEATAGAPWQFAQEHVRLIRRNH